MNIFFDGRSISWYSGTGIGNYSFSLINALSTIDRTNMYDLFFNEKTPLNLHKNFSFINSMKLSDNFWESVSHPIDSFNKDYSIYHCPHNGIGIKYLDSIKYVVTLHDIIPIVMPSIPSKNFLRIFNNSIEEIIKNADAIITVSNYSKNDIHKYLNYPLDKIFVTYIAPDPIFKPHDKQISKKYINKKYGINKDFLLYIGGFSPRKNILLTIDVFEKIHKKYKNKNLVICGNKGISYSLYKERVDKLSLSSCVFFPGFIPREDLPLFYSACEIFIYPSIYEGFGLPPLESMACGSPVITSNVTSIPEIVKDSAVLFDPTSKNQFYDSIDLLLSDKNIRNSYILKGFHRAGDFSFLNTAKETLKIYEKLKS